MGALLQPILALLLVLTREETVPLRGRGAPGEAPQVMPVVLAILAYLAIVGTSSALAVRKRRREGGSATGALPPALGTLHLLAFAALLFGTQWIELVLVGIGDWPVISTLIGMVPFLLGFALRTAIAYDALPADRRGPGRRAALVVFHLRVAAIPLLPILLINGLRRLVFQSLDGRMGSIMQAYLPLFIVMLLAITVLVFAVAPLLVRWIVYARPMPPGPLRQRLDRYCETIGFRPTNILVWNTGGLVTNALFIGIVPWLRYVVMTDALLERLEEAEVEAVFAHEAGHGSRRHTQLFLVYAAGFITLEILLQDRLSTLGALSPMFGMAFAIVFNLLGLILFFGVFGWISRRFETEADIFAVRTLQDPQAFGRALERVGLHAGSAARRGGLRHFGIGTRIGLLARYAAEPEFRESFDRLLRRLRIGILGLALGSLLIVGLRTPDYLVEGDVRLGGFDVLQAARTGDLTLARDALPRLRRHREDASMGPDARRAYFAGVWLLAKDALSRGDEAEARRWIDVHAEAADDDPLVGFNRDLLTALRDAHEGRFDRAALAALEAQLARLLRELPGLDTDSVYEDFSDIWLLRRAAGELTAVPRNHRRLSPVAELVYRIGNHGRRPVSAALVERLVSAAREDGAYRRLLLKPIAGTTDPRAAAEALLKRP